MITDADVTKLKRVFLTKKEASEFLTKQDGKGFASALDMEIVKTDLREVKQDVRELKVMMGKTLAGVDKMAGRVGTLEEENKMGARTVARHTRQIEALAVHTGIKLPN